VLNRKGKLFFYLLKK